MLSKVFYFEKIVAVLHELSIEETALALKRKLSMSLSLSVKFIDVEFLKLERLSSGCAFICWVSDVSLVLMLSVSQSLWVLESS